MARIFIDPPESFRFRTEIPLLYAHINRGGHLDNAMVLSLATEARIRFLAPLGYDEQDIEGLTVFTGDSAVQYLSEAFYGDIMVIDVATRDFNKYGYDCVFRLSDKASGREVARGKFGMVFYDKAAKKVALMPEAFKARIGD